MTTMPDNTHQRDPIDEHDALRKAAIVYCCLDPPDADALLRQVLPHQASRVRSAAEQLGVVSADERSRVMEEFLRLGPMVPNQHVSGIELDGTLAETIATKMTSSGNDAPPPPSDRPPFRFLHEAAGETLAPVLAREHPQTVAVVLANLPPARAAEVLIRLNPSLQEVVVRRLVDLDDSDPEMIREVELGLELLLKDKLQSRRRSAGLVAVQSILSAVDGDDRDLLLANLARSDRDLAEKLATDPARLVPATAAAFECDRRSSDRQTTASPTSAVASSSPKSDPAHAACPVPQSPARSDSQRESLSAPTTEPPTFQFQEVLHLDDLALRAVLSSADPNVIRIALVGASQALIRRVLQQFSAPQAKQLREQFDQIGPTRLRDVEQAQRQIARVASQMIADGVIQAGGTRRFAVTV